MANIYGHPDGNLMDCDGAPLVATTAVVWNGWTARELFDMGLAVDPETGEVWDWETCRACGGSGAYRHNPAGFQHIETLDCEECGGGGRYPAKGYTR